MAIKPEEAIRSSDAENHWLEVTEKVLDDRLKGKYGAQDLNLGVTIQMGMNVPVRDRFIQELCQKYRDVGWIVGYEKGSSVQDGSYVNFHFSAKIKEE